MRGRSDCRHTHETQAEDARIPLPSQSQRQHRLVIDRQSPSTCASRDSVNKRKGCPNPSATESVCPLSCVSPHSLIHPPGPVPLSVVKKKGKDAKTAKIEQIRNCVEQHKNIFIFKYDHLKTEKLQQIRRDWSGSR